MEIVGQIANGNKISTIGRFSTERRHLRLTERLCERHASRTRHAKRTPATLTLSRASVPQNTLELDVQIEIRTDNRHGTRQC
jgi:hypothetical protein